MAGKGAGATAALPLNLGSATDKAHRRAAIEASFLERTADSARKASIAKTSCYLAWGCVRYFWAVKFLACVPGTRATGCGGTRSSCPAVVARFAVTARSVSEEAIVACRKDGFAGARKSAPWLFDR